MEGRGIWHALSASVTQQLIGPIRLRGDLRCALDLPSSVQPVCQLYQLWLDCLIKVVVFVVHCVHCQFHVYMVYQPSSCCILVVKIVCTKVIR